MHKLTIAVTTALFALLPSTAQAGEKEMALYGKALDWLIKAQKENGGFGPMRGMPNGEIGITGLVIKALADAPQPFQAKARPAGEKAAKFLLKHQRKDGAFAMERGGLTTYRTAIAITALTALDRAKYKSQVEAATKWLISDQFDAEEKVGPNNPHYGGFGYDKGKEKPDADLSNTLMAVAALKDAGIKPDDPVFKRALTFITRCQNSSETNPGVGGLRPRDDGGFIYDPGLDRNKSGRVENEDGSFSFDSYASMTYGGLMSLIYSGVSRRDPRVVAAKAWIANNYTLEENYGLGLRAKDPKASQQGLYYYYHVFAKCLSALKSPTINTKHGPRYWAKDLFAAFAARQSPPGFFRNPNDRWWEQDPVLVTAYVLNSMNLAIPFLPSE